nr:immunoglobulin heavy chain junction region [Macaca mulatta]MOV49087.1 immunoglobulin heavy chain junction region [Macaca mulatta]MOV49466.1 immunoglobulin heavy chain junction region [Macaca mulatta]MOV52128.1 immunoglobulin heavy chain junction region [Macaca mulatta]
CARGLEFDYSGSGTNYYEGYYDLW